VAHCLTSRGNRSIRKADGGEDSVDRATAMSTASPIIKDVSDSLSNNPSRDGLIGVIETLVSEAERANDERERLRQENEELQKELSEVRDENEQLQAELSEARQLLDSTRREQAEIRSDVHELTQTVESPDNGDTDTVESDSEGETPTVQWLAKPETMPDTTTGS